MVQNRQNVKVNPFTFWRNLTIFGTFFKVHFFENYTSYEAQTQLKTFFTGLKNFKNGPKSSKKVKVKTLYSFLGVFFQSQFFPKLYYTSNEAQTKLKTLTTIYIRPGEYKKLFARANIYGYSPRRI